MYRKAHLLDVAGNQSQTPNVCAKSTALKFWNIFEKQGNTSALLSLGLRSVRNLSSDFGDALRCRQVAGILSHRVRGTIAGYAQMHARTPRVIHLLHCFLEVFCFFA